MPPKKPKGIAHHLEIGVRSSTFFFVSTLNPLAPANIPKIISNIQKMYFDDEVDGHYFVVVDITEQNRESIQMFLV
jgi:hypothetical protein